MKDLIDNVIDESSIEDNSNEGSGDGDGNFPQKYFSPPDGQTLEEWLTHHGMSPDVYAEWRTLNIEVKRLIISRHQMPVSHT